MPTYEYKCAACEHEWEAEQSIKEDPLKTCPKCEADEAKRQISLGSGFILKGGGWYSDLYASSAGSKADKPEAAAKADSKNKGSAAAGSSSSGASEGSSSTGSSSTGSSSTGSSGKSGSSGSSGSSGGGGASGGGASGGGSSGGGSSGGGSSGSSGSSGSQASAA